MTTAQLSISEERSSWTDSDRRWGYRFGCDGTVNFSQASELMAKASERTIERRIAEGKIRQGKDGARVVICRRSVMDYIATLES